MKKETDLIRKKLNYLSTINEFDARHFVGLWAIELGWGGISKVNELTGKSMDTIRKGIYEIETKNNLNLKERGRLRKEGGGRKKIVEKNPEVKKDIENILEDIENCVVYVSFICSSLSGKLRLYALQITQLSITPREIL